HDQDRRAPERDSLDEGGTACPDGEPMRNGPAATSAKSTPGSVASVGPSLHRFRKSVDSGNSPSAYFEPLQRYRATGSEPAEFLEPIRGRGSPPLFSYLREFMDNDFK